MMQEICAPEEGPLPTTEEEPVAEAADDV
jgi:hypothetical protein